MKIIQANKLLLIFTLFFILISCSQDKNNGTVEIVEMKGYVLAKYTDMNLILVVPNIDFSIVEEIMDKESESNAVAQDNGGINFYVSKETIENVNIGDQVLVKYDQFGDVEESDPPNRIAESVEFLEQ